jgi:prepilin peptidase CpaA
LVLCIAAAFFDLRKRIIPNKIITCICIYGILRALFLRGVEYTLSSLIYSLGILLVLYVLYVIDALGAGDVKLYSLVPLYCNRDKILLFYFLIFCVAAVLALGRMILLPSKRKQLIQFCYSLRLIFLNQIIKPMQVPQHSPDHIPMAVPMAIGIMISMILDNIDFIDFFF